MGVIRTTKDVKASKKSAAAAPPRSAAATARPTRPATVVSKGLIPSAPSTPAASTQQQQQQSAHPSSDAWWLSDVSFVVDGKQVQAHKVVLSSRSQYFASLFQSEPSKTSFVISNVSHAIFAQFIRWCYAGSKDINPDAAFELRVCGVAYNVPDLVQVCDASIMAHQPHLLYPQQQAVQDEYAFYQQQQQQQQQYTAPVAVTPAQYPMHEKQMPPPPYYDGGIEWNGGDDDTNNLLNSAGIRELDQHSHEQFLQQQLYQEPILGVNPNAIFGGM